MKYVSFLLAVFLLLPITAEGKKRKKVINRKTQVHDFTGDTIDGKSRSPDSAYVVQKRSVDFVPLYKVREAFDENIKNSVEYLK